MIRNKDTQLLVFVTALVVLIAGASLFWSVNIDANSAVAELKLYNDTDTPCGPLSVAIVGGWLGPGVTLADARRVVHTDSFGRCSMNELVNGLEELGFSSVGVRLPSHMLSRVELPLILHINGDHFAAAVSLKDNQLMILDPPNPPVVVAPTTIFDNWDGSSLLVARTDVELENCLRRLGLKHRS